MKISGFVLTAILAALSAVNVLAQDADRGAEGYKLCASCHGFKAEGNALVNAPALGGQEAWYLERQINYFHTGVRGSDVDDDHGKRMATMTRGLASAEEIADIVAYIGKLPVAAPEATLEGDAATGKPLYAACAACHGSKAEGNATLNAPALVNLDDWYQLTQLQKFRNGQRGADASDTYGRQMAPMAAILADEKAMRDVIAYIGTLR